MSEYKCIDRKYKKKYNLENLKINQSDIDQILNFIEEDFEDNQEKRYLIFDNEDILHQLSLVDIFNLKMLKYYTYDRKNIEYIDKNILENIIKETKNNLALYKLYLNINEGNNIKLRNIKISILKKLINENFFLENNLFQKILQEDLIKESDRMKIIMNAFFKKQNNIPQIMLKYIKDKDNIQEIKLNLLFNKETKNGNFINSNVIKKYKNKTEYIDLILCIKNKKNKELIYSVLDRRSYFKYFEKDWFNLKLLALNYLMDHEDERKYNLLYKILEETKSYKLSENLYNTQQFKLGYAAIKLRKNEIALNHFLNYYHNAKKATDKAKAAYWIHHIYKITDNGELSKKYKDIASEFFLSFYGQKMIEKTDPSLLGNIVRERFIKDEIKIQKEIEKPFSNILFTLTAILNEKDNIKLATEFMKSFIKNEEDEISKYIGLSIMKDSQFYQEISSYALEFNVIRIDNRSFPIDKRLNNSPIIHAIIKQESNFKTNAKSNKGARGMMQIMPSTGRVLAKKMNMKKFKIADLNKPEINIKLGLFYLDLLSEMFNNNTILILAAYNAGSRNVDKWLEKNGDIRNSRDIQKIIEWVENIPFKETREYIQKILPNEIIYQILISSVKNKS